MLEGDSLGEDHRINTVLTKCITQAIWFEIFWRGVEIWVESKSRTDQSISIEVMKLLIKKMEVAVKGKVIMLQRRDLTKKGA